MNILWRKKKKILPWSCYVVHQQKDKNEGYRNEEEDEVPDDDDLNDQGAEHVGCEVDEEAKCMY